MSNELQMLSSALATIVSGTAPGVVSVSGKNARSSGFVWRAGLIVTADERLAEDGDVTVRLPDGASVAAKVAGRDASTDIALLRIDRTDVPPVSLASAIPSAGSLAVAVGAGPDGPVAALGMVAVSAGPWQSMRGGKIDHRIELDARLRPSSDGSLAVDANGQAFGMVVLGARRRVLVIPSATIARVADKLEQHGKIPRGYLGLSLHPVTVAERGSTGAMVMNVDPQGPGAAAGIHQGDVLVAWNGSEMGRMRSLMRSLGPDSVGETVTFDLQRGGQTITASVRIAERPTA